MQNDIKALIEKYKADLMQYHAQNRSNLQAVDYTAEAAESAFEAATGPTPYSPPNVDVPLMPDPPKPTEPTEAPPSSSPELPDEPPLNSPEEPTPPPMYLPEAEPTSQPSILQEQPSNTSAYISPSADLADDVADNKLDDDEGYLQIRTVTAEGAVPLKNAVAVITDGKTGALIAQLRTDADGLTAAVPLRTLSRTLSEVEGNPQPYDTYNIEITLDGFYGVKSENVAVFGGITNLQTVSLIPLPEFAKQGEEYVISSPDYSL